MAAWFHREGWEYFSWPFLGGGGTLGSRFPGPVVGLDFGPLSGSISWSLRGLEFGSLRPPFLIPFAGPILFFCLVLNLLGPLGLDFLAPLGPHFLGRFGGLISWSFGGLDFFFVLLGFDFLVLSGARFPFGPLRARFFLVHSGARFLFWSSRGLDFLLVLSGARFFLALALDVVRFVASTVLVPGLRGGLSRLRSIPPH